MSDVLGKLRTMSTVPPREGGAYEAWLQQADAFAFLTDNLNDSDFVVYAAMPHLFVHAVLVPKAALDTPDIDDLMSWNCNPYSSWGTVYGFSEPQQVAIAPPLDGCGSKTIAKGEQVVFARSFQGHAQRGSYVEVVQRFAHVFDVHHVAERNAYCRLDRHGDVEDVVRIIKIKADHEYYGGTIVTCDRRVLDEYAALTDAAVVRMFDFTRYEPGQFGGWHDTRAERRTGKEMFYRFVIEPGYGSYPRGIQIVHSNDTRQAIHKRFMSGVGRSEKRYESFIAFDWKNGRVEEISCDPAKLANYFIESNLPFEISPAFFRPEVLLKYKVDRDKYHLTERSVSCRGTWSLETYDINDAGQVHTYLKYLGDLPESEQLHWKQYNEAPKAAISQRAFTTDFKGEFWDKYDPLPSLRERLRNLHKLATHWWRLRSDDLLDRPLYPVTAATDEWREEILTLDQLLVEDFQETWLRKKAKDLGRAPEPNFRSLKLIEECLIGLGFDEEHARSVTSALHELHNLRSKLKGHASGDVARSIGTAALSKHGTYRAHFEDLCKKCDEAMEMIMEAFQSSRMG